MKYPPVKFIGNFRDLIPDGWQFQKLYARNYRQYHKTHDGKPYSQGLRIWQHHGGYVELDDLFELTYLVFQGISNGSINSSDGKVVATIIDKNNGLLLTRNDSEYLEISIQEYEDDYWYEKYRRYVICPGTIDMIKTLIDRKQVEI